MDNNIIWAIVLVIIAFIVLIFMTYLEKSKNKKNVNVKTESLKTQSNGNKTKKNYDFDKNLTVETLRYPFLIQTMAHNELAKAYEVIYDTFSFLDYPNKNNEEFMKKEWHTWQISILMKYLSKHAVFIKPNHKDIIPDEINSLSKTVLKRELNLLVKKYYHSVDIHKSKNFLCNELVWTARDMSIILKSIIDLANEK